MNIHKTPKNNIFLNLNDNKSIEELIKKWSNEGSNDSLIDLLNCIIHLRKKNYQDAIKKCTLSLSKGVSNFEVLIEVFSEIYKIKSYTDFENFLKCFNPFFTYLIKNQQFLNSLDKILSTIGFRKDNSEKKLMIIGEFFVAPLIKQSFKTNFFELALRLENIYYNILVTGIETNEAFDFGMSLIKQPGTKAGTDFNKMLQLEKNKTSNSDVPTVGFFIHNASMLAHIGNIFSFLKYNQNKINKSFSPIIFCFSGNDDVFHRSFSEIGVQIEYLHLDKKGQIIHNYIDRFAALKRKCHSINLSKMVWVCLATHMPFAFGMKLAQEQIWWSQKWTKLKLPTIDKYIYSGSFALNEFRDGNNWKTGWIQRESWLDSVNVNEVNNIKNVFNGKLILGSLAREDKLKNPKYIEMVSKILNENPDTVFLWTGRKELSQIKSIFRSKGVIDRTHFIGWVNTSVFAHVIDILLDSFPTGNGITALQAMQAGKPVIFKYVKGSLAVFIYSALNGLDGTNKYGNKIKDIFQIKEGYENLFTCAENNKEYFTYAKKLISSKVYRDKVGLSYQNFIKNLMSNPFESSEIFYNHLMK